MPCIRIFACHRVANVGKGSLQVNLGFLGGKTPSLASKDHNRSKITHASRIHYDLPNLKCAVTIENLAVLGLAESLFMCTKTASILGGDRRT
jgi:hypothetical protein